MSVLLSNKYKKKLAFESSGLMAISLYLYKKSCFYYDCVTNTFNVWVGSYIVLRYELRGKCVKLKLTVT